MASLPQSAAQPAPTGLQCPHCAATLDLTLPACATCGLRLRGDDAARLWQVDQWLAQLGAERQALISRLLDGSAAAQESARPVSADVPNGVYQRGPARASVPSLSGQQILLGLGAVLLLSAATFFGFVVWMVVGVWGQALLLSGMTALAVTATALATRRGLPAAAETAAVLASGLTAVGVWAAWSLDLGGLRDVSPALYGALAALVVGALVLGYDRVVPRHDGLGSPLRQVVTYRPVAMTSLSLAPWLFFVHAAPTGVGVTLGLGLVALACGGLWVVARRLDDRAPTTVPPAVGAGLAALLYLLFGLAIAHDVSVPTREWSALLMLSTAGVLAVAGTRLSLPGRVGEGLGGLSAPVAGVAAWSFTWEAPWVLLLGAAVASAVAVVALTFVSPLARTAHSLGLRCTQAVLALAGAGLTLELLVLHRGGDHALSGGQEGSAPGLVAVVAAAAVWVVASVVMTVRLRSLLWLVWAHLALMATLTTALLESDARAWSVVWTVAAVALAAAAALALVRLGIRHGWPGWWDGVPSVFAAGFATIAVVASSGLPHPWTAWTLVVVGMIAFAFSLLPGRLFVAYLASPVISAGVALHVVEAGWDVIEAFTWPLAGLLSLVGWRHWRQEPSVRSRVSMGPALSVALVPSTLVAIDTGDAVRLALVTAAGVALLVVGLAKRLQAPVAVAAIVLALVGVTQGGPYIELLPGWLTLGVAGLTLLAAGVFWERTVVAGRRGSVWFAELK